MQPRVLFRTHYQVDEPAIVGLLVTECTSPIQSSYDDSVAECLATHVRSLGKDFNIAAAGYALDLARGLELVTNQNHWTEKGHLLALCVESRDQSWEEQLELPLKERLLYLRLFLESDGAALSFLARRLLDAGRVPNGDDDWNSIARDLYVETFTQYLELSSTTDDRVSLRGEIDRIRTRGYTGKSGSHKLFIHLQLLFRVGLADRLRMKGGRRYEVAGDTTKVGLEGLLEHVGNVYALEKAVRERRLMDVVARSLLGHLEVLEPGLESTQLLRLLVPNYQRIVATGVALCPLSTIVEAVQLELMAERRTILPYQAAVDTLEQSQRDHLGEIRFHVDRRGNPAFIKLSDSIIESFGSPPQATPTES